MPKAYKRYKHQVFGVRPRVPRRPRREYIDCCDENGYPQVTKAFKRYKHQMLDMQATKERQEEEYAEGEPGVWDDALPRHPRREYAESCDENGHPRMTKAMKRYKHYKLDKQVAKEREARRKTMDELGGINEDFGSIAL